MATVVKRGEYQYQATVRRRGHPTRTQTFISKRDAEAWARRTESEMERGIWKDNTIAETTTFGDLLKRYRTEVTPNKKGAQIETLRLLVLEKHWLAKVRMAQLSSMEIASYRDERLKSVKPGTTNRDLNLISVVINTARKDWGLPIENPVMMIRRPKNPRGRERRLEDGEEQRLLDAIDQDKQFNRSPWTKPIAVIALETGMRRGEILGLLWKNVDLGRRVARIEDTKNGDARSVPLSSRAIEVLRALPRSFDGRVFPITSNALKLAYTRAVRRAGIEDLTFHDLRHEAASRLADRLSAHELAKVMGWRTMQMALRYYHPRAEDLARKLG